MEMFNSSSRDNIASRVKKVIVTTEGGSYELQPEEAAQQIDGIVFRKYVEGQRIRVKFEFDYSVGAQMLVIANYGNGYSEKFEYVKE